MSNFSLTMSNNNKRQRTTSSNRLCVNDLPDGLLVGISRYLAKPSVALFAIAMATTNSQEQTQTTKAIISAFDWSVLDFGDIEKILASKLSDGVIDKILRNIDAVNDLHILKLAGCVNISGIGLNVLRSSVVIKQIDLSLVGKHESPLIEPDPLLSESVVLPILDSIIDSRGSSLEQLEFPKNWRNTASTQMTQFLVRYNQYMRNQGHRCFKCNRSCDEHAEDDENRWVDFEGDGDEWHGTQNMTCSQCLHHICCREDCEDDSWCRKCEKVYCKSCVAMNGCVVCEDYFCDECQKMEKCEREGCGEPICEGCSKENTCSYCDERTCDSCNDSFQCGLDGCNKVICEDCIVSKREGGRCDDCGIDFCSTECRYLACGDDASKACSTCSLVAASSFRRKLQESLFGQEILTLEVGEEPTTGDVARVKIMMPDGTRLVRKFAGDSPVKLIYAFVAQSNVDAKGGRAFKLTVNTIDLFANIDDGIKSCGLHSEDSYVNASWK